MQLVLCGAAAARCCLLSPVREAPENQHCCILSAREDEGRWSSRELVCYTWLQPSYIQLPCSYCGFALAFHWLYTLACAGCPVTLNYDLICTHCTSHWASGAQRSNARSAQSS
jgi:hypothetical protein